MNTNTFLFAALFVSTTAFATGCANEEVASSSDETSNLSTTTPAVERAVALPTEVIGRWTFADATIPGWSDDRIDLSITAEQVDVDVLTLASYEHPLEDKSDAVHARGTGTVRFTESGIVRIENLSGATAFSIDLRITETGVAWCKTDTRTCVSLTKSEF